jgi:hypothetical protein
MFRNTVAPVAGRGIERRIAVGTKVCGAKLNVTHSDRAALLMKFASQVL